MVTLQTAISSCMSFFGFPSVTEFIDQRRSNFFSKFNASDKLRVVLRLSVLGSVMLLLKCLMCLCVRDSYKLIYVRFSHYSLFHLLFAAIMVNKDFR